MAIGMRVLEPSAGTGRLLEALPGIVPLRPGAPDRDAGGGTNERRACGASSLEGLAGHCEMRDFLECSAEQLGACSTGL